MLAPIMAHPSSVAPVSTELLITRSGLQTEPAHSFKNDTYKYKHSCFMHNSTSISVLDAII